MQVPLRLLMKNTLWMLLGVLLVLCAGCSASPTEAPLTQTAAPTAIASQTPAPDVGVVRTPTATAEPQSRIDVKEDDLRGLILHFWHTWSGSSAEVISTSVVDFNLNNPWGIIVVVDNLGNLDELDRQFLSAQENGETPDLLVGTLYQAQRWDENSHLANLDDYVNDPVWGYSEGEIADFYPLFWQYDLVGGKRLGIPAQRSGQVLFYNQTWARELGYADPPKSFDDFATQACAAALTNPGAGLGGWAISTEYPAILSWIYASGAQIYLEDAKPSELNVYQFAQEKVEKTFLDLRNLFDRGCAWLPENPWPEAYFAERSALFASGSVMDIPYFKQAMQLAGNADEWTVLPYPGAPGVSALDVYGTSFIIFQSSPQKQLAAWLLMKWLLEPQPQARLVEASAAFPLRQSVFENLSVYAKRNPQWSAAVALLDLGRAEPRLASWGKVRWALSDAATQLFRSYTTADAVPNLVRFLDRTAEDLHP